MAGETPSYSAISKRLMAERRSGVRVACTLKGRCRRTEGAEAQDVAVRNISSTGMAFVNDEALAPGTVLHIDLQSACGQRSLAAQVAVLHSHSLSGERWFHGCRFATPLDVQALRELTESARPG